MKLALLEESVYVTIHEQIVGGTTSATLKVSVICPCLTLKSALNENNLSCVDLLHAPIVTFLCTI